MSHRWVHTAIYEMFELPEKAQLIRLFKKSLNTTPIQYEIRKKMEYAKGMLLYSNESVAEISDRAGYSDIAYFSKMFKKYTGYSPSEYRKIIRET